MATATNTTLPAPTAIKVLCDVETSMHSVCNFAEVLAAIACDLSVSREAVGEIGFAMRKAAEELKADWNRSFIAAGGQG